VFSSAGASTGVGNFNWFRFVESSSPSTTTPYGGTPVALPGTVQAENFDVGAQGAAYLDTAAGNSGKAYRSTDVDVAATRDPSNGGYYVGWTRTGEWLQYTVDVTETRTYALHVRVANAGSGAAFRIEVDGADSTGAVSVPNTGGWDVWQTITLNGIPLSQGTRFIRLVMVAPNAENSGVGNYGYVSFE
jgi:hypothetical protein